MITTTLRKEITTTIDNNNLEQERLLKEVQKQLEQYSDEDFAFIKSRGLDIKPKESEFAKVGKNPFDKKVISIKQIEKIAISYGLRFLPINYYTGKIDPALIQKMKEYESNGKNKIRDINDSITIKNLYTTKRIDSEGRVYSTDNSIIKQIESNCYSSDAPPYFVLAPAKMFKLKNIPFDYDPFVFAYCGNEHFDYIHHWGNDITFLRKIINFPKSTGWKNFFSFVFLLSFLNIFLGVHFSWAWWAILIINLIGIPFLSMITAATSQIQNYISEYNWANPFNNKRE